MWTSTTAPSVTWSAACCMASTPRCLRTAPRALGRPTPWSVSAHGTAPQARGGSDPRRSQAGCAASTRAGARPPRRSISMRTCSACVRVRAAAAPPASTCLPHMSCHVLALRDAPIGDTAPSLRRAPPRPAWAHAGACLHPPTGARAHVCGAHAGACMHTCICLCGAWCAAAGTRDDPGLMLLSLQRIFVDRNRLFRDEDMEVACTYLEVYNEVGGWDERGTRAAKPKDTATMISGATRASHGWRVPTHPCPCCAAQRLAWAFSRRGATCGGVLRRRAAGHLRPAGAQQRAAGAAGGPRAGRHGGGPAAHRGRQRGGHHGGCWVQPASEAGRQA